MKKKNYATLHKIPQITSVNLIVVEINETKKKNYINKSESN